MALNLGLGDLDQIDLEGADFEDILLSTIVGVFEEKKRKKTEKTSKKSMLDWCTEKALYWETVDL